VRNGVEVFVKICADDFGVAGATDRTYYLLPTVTNLFLTHKNALSILPSKESNSIILAYLPQASKNDRAGLTSDQCYAPPLIFIGCKKKSIRG
jgi:hypothetical protein